MAQWQKQLHPTKQTTLDWHFKCGNKKVFNNPTTVTQWPYFSPTRGTIVPNLVTEFHLLFDAFLSCFSLAKSPAHDLQIIFGSCIIVTCFSGKKWRIASLSYQRWILTRWKQLGGQVIKQKLNWIWFHVYIWKKNYLLVSHRSIFCLTISALKKKNDQLPLNTYHHIWLNLVQF